MSLAHRTCGVQRHTFRETGGTDRCPRKPAPNWPSARQPEAVPSRRRMRRGPESRDGREVSGAPSCLRGPRLPGPRCSRRLGGGLKGPLCSRRRTLLVGFPVSQSAGFCLKKVWSPTERALLSHLRQGGEARTRVQAFLPLASQCLQRQRVAVL